MATRPGGLGRSDSQKARGKERWWLRTERDGEGDHGLFTSVCRFRHTFYVPPGSVLGTAGNGAPFRWPSVRAGLRISSPERQVSETTSKSPRMVQTGDVPIGQNLSLMRLKKQGAIRLTKCLLILPCMRSFFELDFQRIVSFSLQIHQKRRMWFANFVHLSTP